MSKSNIFQFDTKEAQAKALAKTVGEQIIHLLSQKSSVTLSVPGGSTPALFFNDLSRYQGIDWSCVNIMANDERCVPSDHYRANEKLLKETLLINNASKATLVSLYGRDKNNDINGLVEELSPHIKSILPIDICILGMGDDGHTASLFPQAVQLDDALNLNGEHVLQVMNVPNMIIDGAEEARISLTLPTIINSSSLYLLMSGEQKLAVYKQASIARNKTWPVSYVLANADVDLYYTS